MLCPGTTRGHVSPSKPWISVDRTVELLVDILLAYGSWFALISCVIILFTGGFTVFTTGNWEPSSFVSSYL